jgi:RNA polymerase sigma-70 factor (ECF subfamily)
MQNLELRSDEEIVEEIRSKDQELYVVIVERYQEKLLRYANRLVKDEHKAMDIVQESFINAFVQLNRFDTKKKFSSWIYRIVHNQSINFLKKYQKETPMPDGVDFKSKDETERHFEQKEFKEMVDTCLGQIPVMYAEPLILYYLEEKSYAEISDILRMPMGTVATRVKRAKIVMKHVCQKT